MVRVCECGCGAEFIPKKSTGRFSSATCRVRWNRARKRELDDAGVIADASAAVRSIRRAPVPKDLPKSVTAAVKLELGDALYTSLGQQALVIAERIDDRVDVSGSAVAALSRQLVILTSAALARSADVERDPVAAVQAQVMDIRRAHAG